MPTAILSFKAIGHPSSPLPGCNQTLSMRSQSVILAGILHDLHSFASLLSPHSRPLKRHVSGGAGSPGAVPGVIARYP